MSIWNLITHASRVSITIADRNPQRKQKVDRKSTLKLWLYVIGAALTAYTMNGQQEPQEVKCVVEIRDPRTH